MAEWRIRLRGVTGKGAWLTLVLMLLVAGPADADPARPTNYRATVTALTPTPIGVRLEVFGGDSFLVLTVEPGHTVDVPGYEDEPYLRVLADGTVERNRRSEATWLNDARYGERDVSLPHEADNSAPPVWERVAAGGAHAWHDHRIHHMSPSLPEQVDPDAGTTQLVWDWEIPLVVDGAEVVAEGRLVWEPSEPPLVGLAAGILALVGVGAMALLWSGVAGAVAGSLLSGLAAASGAAAILLAAPPGAPVEPLTLALPLAAVGAALAAGAASRSRPVLGPLVSGLAALPALVWALGLLGALTAPSLPADPALVLRMGVGVALGAGVGAVASGVWGFLEAEPSPDGHQTFT